MKKKLTAVLSYLLIFAMLITPTSVSSFAETKDEDGFDEISEEIFEEESSAFTDADEEDPGDAEAPAEDEDVDAEDPDEEEPEAADPEEMAEETEEEEMIDDAVDLFEVPEDPEVPGDADDDLPAETVVTTEKGELRFTLQNAYLMYGEDGSNKEGNLDELFVPSYILNDTKYELNADPAAEKSFRVAYKFTKDKTLKDTITAEEFDALQSEKLEDINAGEKVLVIAKAESTDADPVIAAKTYKIEKRKITIRLGKTRSLEVTEKEMPEDGKLVVSEADAKEMHITAVVSEGGEAAATEGETEAKETSIEATEDSAPADGASEEAEEAAPAEDAEEAPAVLVSEGFAHAEELSGKTGELIDGDIIYDVSGIDGDTVGYQQVPALFSLAPELAKNYEVIEPVGYVYVEESVYHVTFEGLKDGVTTFNGYINDVETATSIKDFLNANYESISNANTPFYKNLVGDANTVRGWDLYKNGCLTTHLGAFFFDADNHLINIEPKQDYYFRAEQWQRVSKEIVVDAVSAVYYDGRAHVSVDETVKSKDKKKKINDLNIRVSYLPTGKGYDNEAQIFLRPGKDYKLTYKNNKNASLKMDEDGQYIKKYTKDSDRPYVIVTGTGNYKGFKTKVYFDIMPYNFGFVKSTLTSPLATVSGLKYTYQLKNGKIQGKINPSASLKFKYGKTASLKKGKDYDVVLWKYSSGYWNKLVNSDPMKITETGRYVYVIRGKGNYCGDYFGQDLPQASFDDGSHGSLNPAVCEYNTGAYKTCQFIVKDTTKYDLANATVTVGKTKVNYVQGKYYTGKDFKIKVKVGSATLAEGTDYYIIYDGADYQYDYAKNISPEYYFSGTSNATRNDNIQAANKYKITIVAKNGNANGFYGKKTTNKTVRIKGTRISKSWFKFAGKSFPFDGKLTSPQYFYYTSNCKVVMQKNIHDYALPYTDISGVRYYDYSDSNYFGMPSQYVKGVCTMSAVDKLPGTYQMTIYAFGPGVDHDFALKTKYKRTAVSMETGIKKGLISVSADPASYNAGGSLPKNLKITFNGVVNNVGDLHYSGEEFELMDGDLDLATTAKTKVKIYAKNNTKPGSKPYLVLQGDGYIFKGKSKTKKFTYAVNPSTVNYTIKEINARNYALSYGSHTTTLSDSYYTAGKIYAMMTPVLKEKKKLDSEGRPKNAKITLYQAYYRNAAEYKEGRLSLAKIPTSQYSMFLTKQDDYGFLVTIQNKTGKTVLETGYSFSPATIDNYYTIYGKDVKIKSVTFKKDGVDYTLSKNSNVTFDFTGSEIRFDSIVSAELSDGTSINGNYLRTEYKNNVAAGKGTVTVYLKYRNAHYERGGSGKFEFTIRKVPDKTL